jgi:hypothetical protein
MKWKNQSTAFLEVSAQVATSVSVSFFQQKVTTQVATSPSTLVPQKLQHKLQQFVSATCFAQPKEPVLYIYIYIYFKQQT